MIISKTESEAVDALKHWAEHGSDFEYADKVWADLHGYVFTLLSALARNQQPKPDHIEDVLDMVTKAIYDKSAEFASVGVKIDNAMSFTEILSKAALTAIKSAGYRVVKG